MKDTGERYIPESSPADVAYEHWHRYFYAQPYVQGRDVLDIASGAAYGSALLAESARSVVGVDIDPEAVAYAQSIYVRNNLRFLQGSVAQIPIEGEAQFDVIVSFETIEHVEAPEQAAFLREVKRLLRPGGILLISTPDIITYNRRKEAYSNEFHKHEFSRAEFLDYLHGAFAHVDCVSQCPLWGSYIHRPGQHAGPFVSYGFECSETGFHPIDDAAENTYIIAACSDAPLPELPFSVSIDKSKLHFKELLRDQAQHRAQWEAQQAALAQQAADAQNRAQQAETRAAAAETRATEAQSLVAAAETRTAAAEARATKAQSLVAAAETRAAAAEARAAEADRAHKDAVFAHQRTQTLFELEQRSATRYREENTILRDAVQEAKLVAAREAARDTTHSEAIATCTAGIDRLYGFLRDQFQASYDRLHDLEQHVGQNRSDIDSIEHTLRRDLEEARQRASRAESATEELRQELIRTKNGPSYRLGRMITWLPRAICSRRVPALVRVPFVALSHPLKTLRALSPRNIRRLFFHLSSESPFDAASVLSNYLSGAGLHPKKSPPNHSVLPTPSKRLHISLPQPPATDITVSIIIPVYNQWHYTQGCLASLAQTLDGIPTEIIVIDDGSSDETQRAARRIPNLRYIRNKHNLGFLRNCKKAASQAHGQYLLFLNNDTNPQPGWLRALVDTLDRDPSAGIVGSKLVYSDGTLQEAGNILWQDASGWNYGRGDDPAKPEYNYLKEVDAVSGASLMIRAELWREIGGFDERLVPAYYEDTDLCFECRAHGKKVLYQPLSVVIHHEGKSCGTETSGGVKSQYLTANQAKFRDKWAAILDREHFPNPQRPEAPEVFLARDRSRFQKCLLYVDHHVPFFDQDAGSRNVYHMLRLFREMGFNVKFIGDNFYPHEPYTTALQQLGIEVLHGIQYHQDKWKDWVHKYADYLHFAFVERPHIALPYIRELKATTHARVIYYGCDLHYLRCQREYELSHDPAQLEAANKWKALELEIFQKADVTTYLSPIETQAVQKLVPSARTAVIPMFVHEYFSETPPTFSAKGTSGILCVGGFGHAPNLDAVQWMLQRVMPLVWKKNPSIPFHIVGSQMPDSIRALASKTIIPHGQLSDADLATLYSQCRISVAPLRYGAGMKGKVVEAFEKGIPLVATSIALEGFTNLPSELTPCDSPETFAKRILTLYKNDAALERLAHTQYDYIATFMSKKSALSAFNTLFQ